jgi:hypothetical protein
MSKEGVHSPSSGKEFDTEKSIRHQEGESIPLKMEQELTALESTQQEEQIPSVVEEELTAVESILCREGEFIRLSETCVRLELETGTWFTVGNALDVFSEDYGVQNFFSLLHSVFQIRIHLTRIRIQQFRLNTIPVRIRIQSGYRALMTKN